MNTDAHLAHLTLRREAQFYNADGKPGQFDPVYNYYGAFWQFY